MKLPYLLTLLPFFAAAQSTWQWHIEPMYTEATSFSEDSMAVVTWAVDGVDTCLAIDYYGNRLFIIPPKYRAVSMFSEKKLVLADQGDRYHRLMDEKGRMGPYFNYIRDFSEGLAAAERDGLWGFINHRGGYDIQPKFFMLESFSEGLAPAGIYDEAKNDEEEGEHYLMGYINKNAHVVIPYRYNQAGAFKQGLAKVQIGQKFGFINTKGKLVIDTLYADAKDFSEGRAAVSPRGDLNVWVRSLSYNYQYGFIDTKGKMVVTPRYVFFGGLGCCHGYNGQMGLY